jgi:hypothetical protein
MENFFEKASNTTDIVFTYFTQTVYFLLFLFFFEKFNLILDSKHFLLKKMGGELHIYLKSYLIPSEALAINLI